MVVKKSKSLENVYESLENLLEYFSSSCAKDLDQRTLSHVESVLLKVESELRVECNYKSTRKRK